MDKIQNQYIPNYVSPPGETLLELINEHGMSQTELAVKIDCAKRKIEEIIQGKTAITPEIALQLENILAVPASFWNNREEQYRQHKIQQEQLANSIDWIKKFSINPMIKLGWIDSCDNKLQQMNKLLKFFNVASPEQWEIRWSKCTVAFRKPNAFQSELPSISAWLRQGEIQAENIDCQPYNADTFRRILEESRQLTLEPLEDFQDKLVNLCAEAGVVVVFVPQIPNAKVSGATRWLPSGKALIQLSLRYKTDDHLWFTFFHEAGHILLHSKDEIFLEDKDTNDSKEKEANEFASNTLIPPDKLARFLHKNYPSKVAIREFAREIGVAPGIVVGRLQYDDYLPFTHCNDLKRNLIWDRETTTT